MKNNLVIVFFVLIFLNGCGSIESVKGSKDSGESVIYETSLSNAWIYTKRIFRENGIAIKEENEKEGTIFGKSEPHSVNMGVFLGVWITSVNEKEVNVTVYSEKAIATGLRKKFAPEDFHQRLKLYLDTE